jgi:CheY-like chemotaxis protein
MENGLDAIEVVKSRSDIDIILMDIKMPEIDGFKATTIIKQINPNIPIIVQTAFEITHIKDHPDAHLFDEIIPKPIDKVQLDLLIKKYLKI